MRKNLMKLFILLSLFMFILSFKLNADTIVLNLANETPGKTKNQSLTYGKIDEIQFKNAYPEKIDKYKFNFKKIVIDPETIPKLKFPSEVRVGVLDFSGITPNCIQLANTLTSYDGIANEAPNNWFERQIEPILKKLKEAMKTCPKKSPNNRDIQNLNKANDIIKDSTLVYSIREELKKGEQLKVILEREDKKWTFIFTYPREKWITSYGFGFVSKGLRKHDLYYVKEDKADSEVTYNLIAEEKPNLFDTEAIPTVFFSWPLLKTQESFYFCFTGGLGFDMTNPVVFFGCSGIVGYNIGITLGIVMYKQFQLKPKYFSETEPMTVKSPLEFDELHRGTYRPSLCLGISFRFGSNPFQAAVAEDEKEKNKENKEKK